MIANSWRSKRIQIYTEIDVSFALLTSIDDFVEEKINQCIDF